MTPSCNQCECSCRTGYYIDSLSCCAHEQIQKATDGSQYKSVALNANQLRIHANCQYEMQTSMCSYSLCKHNNTTVVHKDNCIKTDITRC